MALVGFQAWLGRETVRLGNSGESVTAHLAAAMLLLGALVFILVRAGYPARLPVRGASQRFTLLATFAAASTFALLLFGSNVTAGGITSSLVFGDWPLMGGTPFPALTELTSAHVLHRWIAVVVGVIVVATAIVAWRTQRDHPTLVRLAVAAGILYPVQALVGGLQVLTKLAAWTQTLHLALGATIWALLAGLAITSYYTARAAAATSSYGGSVGARDGDPDGTTPRSAGDSVRAYIALTKPRIIELLLVTTVPAMVLAIREVPGIQWQSWGWLVVWTLIGGTLAAGSANAINCYLDRDIDELMARTRRRPLPAHQVEPERAVVFGVALGIVSFVVMAWFVNLLAAYLTLLAIAFYVVVYTIMLKRTTPQNIVIGGAAGALPPLIGWVAVTGQVGIPALLLFAARLLLDAAAFLGAVAADPQGLRRGRGADAPRGEGHPRDDAPDRPVHDPDGRDLAGPVGRRPDGCRSTWRPPSSSARCSCGRRIACGGTERRRRPRRPARSGCTATRSRT